MREVPVPIGCASRPSRPCWTAIVLIAAWLVVLQAFLAGVTTARVGAMPISSPIDVATICHGAGGKAVDDSTAPLDTARHLCCVYCTCAASLLASPGEPRAVVLEPRRESRATEFARFTVVISHAAVRAGLSQAPPNRA